MKGFLGTEEAYFISPQTPKKALFAPLMFRICGKILNPHNRGYSKLFNYTNRIDADTIFLDRGYP